MIKLSGKIKKVFNTETFNTFEKRTFWLEDVSEKYPNTWQLELWTSDIDMIDHYSVGDFVTVYIDIKGKDKKSNKFIKTGVFALKKRLVEAIYNIKIKMV